MVLVGLSVVERGFLISVLRIGVKACDCIHLYLVFTFLQFSRIDSISQPVKLVYLRVTQIPSGIVPVKLLLAHHC